MMLKRNMMTLGLIGLLNIGEMSAMENAHNPNPDTVNRIVGIIQDLGFQENTPDTKDIILDALQGVMATDMEIAEAFETVESQGKQMPQDQNASGKLGREMTATEEENAYKMWLMKQALEKGANEGTLPYVPTEVQNVIGGKLHELSANPVLDGELKFAGAPKPFKIRDLVKEDGSIDLSNPIFGDASKYLLITTDPEQFFNIVENSKRLVILIAPKFLIEEKIGSSAKPFQRIMAEWKEDQAPIGIFSRMEGDRILPMYDYLTTKDILIISKNNLYDALFRWGGAYVTPFAGERGSSALKKFHVYFKQKLD